MFLSVHCFDAGRTMILLDLYSIFIKFLEFFFKKIPLAFDIYFFGSPYSEKMTLHATVRLFPDGPSFLLIIGNLL